MNCGDEREAKKLFQELPFYNKIIEKPNITGLKNINLPQEFPLHDELNIMQISKAFGWFERSHKVEIVDSKDPLAQLEFSESSIKDLFKDFLDEIKDFKYQIRVKVLLRKHKQNGDIESAPVYLNSTTKTVINLIYDLDKSFEEVLYRINNWINEGSGWLTESIDAEYVNISVYSPLSGSTNIKLPFKLKSAMKGLINNKNNYNVFFGAILDI